MIFALHRRTPSMRAPAFISIALILITPLISCTSKAGDKTIRSAGETKGQMSGSPPVSVQNAGVVWKMPDGRAPRFLFIHHSTGSGFLDEGGMREKLKAAGFEVHDRTYGDGWVGENTNPDHFPITFTQHYDDMISWELGQGQKYDIVAFKSCFPASNVCSDEELDKYKKYYETIKTVTKKHPETLFIAFSTPPLVPGATKPDCAKRARMFADWLKGPYDENEKNLVAYDLFDVLAESSPSSPDFNCLKKEYRKNESDSHPNKAANQSVADNFTAWLTKQVG